jgi:hypothetical protein
MTGQESTGIFYRLVGHDVVQCASGREWADWYETSESRIVARDEFDGFLISTIFVGIEQEISKGPPLLFETMIFRHGAETENRGRYATWAAAEHGHAAAVTWARGFVARSKTAASQ